MVLSNCRCLAPRIEETLLRMRLRLLLLLLPLLLLLLLLLLLPLLRYQQRASDQAVASVVVGSDLDCRQVAGRKGVRHEAMCARAAWPGAWSRRVC